MRIDDWAVANAILLHYRRKSNKGMDTLPSSSGPLRCLLESGELLAFWFRIPNKERLSIDSKGRRATGMGKCILGVKKKFCEQEGFSGHENSLSEVP